MSFASRQDEPLADPVPNLHCSGIACRPERTPQTESTPTADSLAESQQDRQNVEQRQAVHCQTALDRIEATLTRLRYDYDLFSYMRDALEVLKTANEVAEFLHRNVLCIKTLVERTRNRRDILTDWLRAKDLADNSVPEDMIRTGTLQFMSINLLSANPMYHSVADDIESFIYVSLWTVGKYSADGMLEADRQDFMRDFDYRAGDRGLAKYKMLTAHPLRRMKVKNGHLEELLNLLVNQLIKKFEPFEEWYKHHVLRGHQAYSFDDDESATSDSEDGADSSELSAPAEEGLAAAEAEKERMVAAKAKFDKKHLKLQTRAWMSTVLRHFRRRKEWYDIVDPAQKPKPRRRPKIPRRVPLIKRRLEERNAREEAAMKRRIE